MSTTSRKFKRGVVLLAVGIALIDAACSRNEHPAEVKSISSSSPRPSASVAVASEIYHGAGTVVSTNPKHPSVELDHEEIVGLMPAMKMEFYVKDASLLSGLQRGDKVSFTIENGVGGLKITEIKKL